ncbi:MAG: rod-binding protein [Desulfobacterales bacterium]|jgi:flagellar protein FlgJ
MTDLLSTPKLPVNLSDIAVGTKRRIQRMQNAKKSAHSGQGTDPKLRDVSRQMESLFIHHLLKEMRATIHKSGFISGGRAEEIYTSMMDAEMAVKIAERGGIGLSEMLLDQLSDPPSEEKEVKSDENQ